MTDTWECSFVTVWTCVSVNSGSWLFIDEWVLSSLHNLYYIPCLDFKLV